MSGKQEKNKRKAWKKSIKKMAGGDLDKLKNLKVELQMEVMGLKKALFWTRIALLAMTAVALVLAIKVYL